MKDMVEYLFETFNPKLSIEFDIAPVSQTGYLPHISLVQDISKISAIGWKPITGLKKIYEIDLARWEDL